MAVCHGAGSRPRYKIHFTAFRLGSVAYGIVMRACPLYLLAQAGAKEHHGMRRLLDDGSFHPSFSKTLGNLRLPKFILFEKVGTLLSRKTSMG